MLRSSARLRLTLTVSALALATAAPSVAPAAVFAWNGGTDLYANPLAWTPLGPPSSGDDAQVYAASSVVEIIGTSQSAGTLELGAAAGSGNQLSLNDGTLTVYQNVVTNNGAIMLANASLLTSGSGTMNFQGTGTITLDNSANYAQLGNGAAEAFGSNQTVQGSGQIGLNNTTIVNAGLISANVSTVGLTLDIDPAGGNGGVGAGNGFGTNGNAGLYNSGVIQATGGGTLNLFGGLYENSMGGVIRATAGSTVNLGGDSRILDGTLTSVGTGVISAANTTQYLQNVTLSSGSNIAVVNDRLYLNTALTNNGTITVSNASQLFAESPALSIGGTGAIVLDDSANSAQFGDGGAITLGAGQTVRGSGQIGLNNTIFTNSGLISGDVSGRNLDIDPAGGNGGVGPGNGVGLGTNAGFLNLATVQANGATTTLEGGQYDNTTGLIRAINGGTLVLGGDSRIIGGLLTSDATSTISAANTTQYLQNVTLSSGSDIAIVNDRLYLNSALTNNGTITVSNASQLFAESPALSIGGTGAIVLDDSTNYAQLGDGGEITFGSGQTVRGSGQIGLNNTIFTNNNLISGDVAGRNLDIDPAGGNGGVSGGLGTGGAAAFLNLGTVQAAGATTTTTLEGGQYDNTTGLIRAINGGTLVLAGDSRIIGGVLTSDATSTISAANTTQYLQNVTLSSGSNIAVVNDRLYLNIALTNNGTITVSNASQLFAESPALSIGGTGAIVLDDSANYAQFGDGGAITLGAGQTVRGSGQIGLNNTIFTNSGLISGNVTGRNLDIDPAGGNGGVGAGNGVGLGTNAAFLNLATVQANGATTTLEGGQYDNTSGLVRAINGGTLVLGGDSRIIGGVLTSDATSTISAANTTQYLQNVTLSSGSNIAVVNDRLYLNTALTNNGTITVSNASQLFAETAALSIGGTGLIVLDDTANYAQLGDGGAITFGAGQTVRGSGQIGLNNTIFTNSGLISGNVSGRNLDIDPAGGNGGVGAGNGVGTNGNSAFYNTGTVQSANGGTTTLEGGLYENSATGTLAALTGGTTTMGSDSSLYNLQAGGVLNQGNYTSATAGAASVLDLQSNAATGIVVIGTSSATTDTVVTLSGANSQINVLAFNQGAPASIDSTLTTVAQSGELVIENGRTFDATGGGGNFTNAGVVKLAAGTFGATSYANGGLTTGNGAVTVAIDNTGTVEAAGGTLSTAAIIGGAGTIRTLAGATLDLTAATAASTAGTLTNNGALALGSQNVTVTSDYTNAAFGSGNAFDRRANVTGSGDIFGLNYTEDLSGPGLSGSTINVGNVRTGGSSSTMLTITNNGTATNIIGAVQNTNASAIAVSNPDFTAAHGGGSATVTLSFTGTTAGALTNQTITVVNNFANIGPKNLTVQGNVYQIAVAGSQPASLMLGASRVGGTAQTGSLTIANVAPNTPGFTESLTSTASTASPFRVNGGASSTVSNIAAGASSPVAVSLGTGTAGAFSSTVAISNTSTPVAGSGFTPLALAGQSVTVSGNVYAPAVASLSSTTVAFGPVRQGSASPTQSLGLTNASVGSLSDSLITSAGALPTGVSATTPGALAQGATGSVAFGLNTATAGQLSGQGTLNFTSHDSQLADLALPSQQVNFTGTVTELAQALLTKDGGVGAFSGAGTTYTLDLGAFTSGTGTDTSTLGVTNGIPNSTYAELLNGALTSASAKGFGFTGQSFTGLVGGGHATGDLLSFDTDGLAAGTYTDVLTFAGSSSYPGLTDETLGPITVDVTAQISGGTMTSAAPEPTVWSLMIVGLGLIGVSLRRGAGRVTRRRAA